MGAIPPEIILLPRWFYINIYEMSSWSRGILVPLSIISARKPHCPVPASANIAELELETYRRKASERVRVTALEEETATIPFDGQAVDTAWQQAASESFFF